jgi:tetrathionate reductase subunit A
VYEGERLAKGYELPVMFYDENVARTRSSMSGRRLSGVPVWEPARGARGSPLEEAFGSAFPLRLVSYKSQTHSSMHCGTRLRDLRPRNFIELGPEDAAALGLSHGARAALETPGGRAEGIVRVRSGLARGVVAIEHGFGHWALGADARVLDGKPQAGDRTRGLGISINRLAPRDPTAGGTVLLADEVTGATARTALPARVVRV